MTQLQQPGIIRRGLRNLAEFFWTGDPVPATVGSPPADIKLFESGEELVNRVYDAITLRRSVLITGPRGSGKSYCALEAIERAEKNKIIRGHHFLQGNREIPRDYLSEDMLVIREPRAGGNPVPMLLDALVTRFPGLTRDEMKAVRVDKAETFPAVQHLTDDRESDTWAKDEWIVLFLDEINRFGDGFLDSLLSLTEERIIVRGGTKLYVPIVVVATANPPGYDITAKKLSPPLQARISRSYRVSQPSHPTLTYVILPEQIRRYRAAYTDAGAANDVEIPRRIRKLVAGAALCMWGEPTTERKGIGFLTPSTRALIEAAASRSQELRADLKALGDLVTFGPDARSVGDWIGCALGIAKRRGEPHVTPAHLDECVIEALGHKVRENFNEGADPVKVAEKENRIARIARCVLSNDHVANVFLAPLDEAVAALTGLDVDRIMRISTAEKPPKGELDIVWWLLEQLAAPSRRAFVDALASGDPAVFKDAHGNLDVRRASIAELVLLAQLESKADPAVATKVTEARKKLPERLAPLDHLAAAIAAFPRLAPWETALRHTIANDSTLTSREALLTWVIAMDAALSALDEAGEPARSALSSFSPAVGDFVLGRRHARSAGPPAQDLALIDASVVARFRSSLPGACRDVSVALATARDHMRGDIAFGHAAFLERGIAAVTERVKASSGQAAQDG